MKPKAIVVDVDGVILDSEIILREILNLKLKGDEMWSYFHKNCNSSKVKLFSNIIPLLQSLKEEVHVILSTARSEKCRETTEKRLKEEGFSYTYLYMRGKDDLRTSSELKKEHLDFIMKEFEVIAFIDDDLSNCQMAKDLGILSLRKV